jgi:nitronate monooxygenase
MFKTRITDMLGIEYPIIQGGMLWLSTAEIAAAVSDAGGLGIISALSFDTKRDLKEEIRKCRDLTDKPFGVNIPMLPDVLLREKTEDYFDAVAEAGVPVVETAGGNPEPYVATLQECGVKVIHKVPAVRYGLTGERIGVDAVTIVGFECAGHPGMDDVTTFILVQKAARALDIPVIAGGGICNAAGFVAALALGAEGVFMGTRFMLTYESMIHPVVKETLLRATELDTMMVDRTIENAMRVVKNDAAMRTLQMEECGATVEELLPVIRGEEGLRAYRDGDVNAGLIACGQVIGLIDSLKTIPEVINDIVSGAHDIYTRLGSVLGR